MNELKDLSFLIEDNAAILEFSEIKRFNKKKLCLWVKQNCGIDLNIDSLFDVHVTRIHEYKR